MNKLIINELKSNLLRYTNKDYSYTNMMKLAINSDFSLIASIILINLFLIVASVVTDTVDIVLNIPYWWTLLIRLPLVAFAICNFQVWQNKYGKIIDGLFLLISLFVPIWSIFLLIYLIFKTYLETIIL